nr:MAG: putative RNA-dependent RNA polymerase [Sanya botourmia-like virus 9]
MPNISSREDFVESALVLSKYSRPPPSRLVAVETGGKWRKITVPSGHQSLLKPLHTSIYNRLSAQPWLLRGKESANVFRDFSTSPGEVFVSGDYESATDNLNTHVSKFVLAQILMRSRSVPAGISRMAMDSLSLPVELRGKFNTRTVEQNSGQMMGYLLSFPLLCLINYLTFKYAVPRDVPLKINGDDIVFRGTRREYEKWVKVVGASGLVLSVGKTMVSRRFFTLNSCLFEGRRDRAVCLPFVRSTALFPKSREPEAVMGIRGRYQSFCPGFSGVKRSRLRVQFLKLNRGLIDVTRRSVSRGLGLCVTFPELVESGLWAREAWHLSLEAERPLPAPFSEWSGRPTGYKYVRFERITKELKAAAEGVGAAWVEAAWQPRRVGVNDWFAEMREGTYDWGHWSWSRTSGAYRRARLLKLSVRNANRFLRPRRSLFNPDSFKLIKRAMWVREDYRSSISFVNGDTSIPGWSNPFGPKSGGELCPDPEFSGVRTNPMLPTEELIFSGKRSVVLRGKIVVESGGRDFSAREDGHTIRVFPSGVGIAPPRSLLAGDCGPPKRRFLKCRGGSVEY